MMRQEQTVTIPIIVIIPTCKQDMRISGCRSLIQDIMSYWIYNIIDRILLINLDLYHLPAERQNKVTSLV